MSSEANFRITILRQLIVIDDCIQVNNSNWIFKAQPFSIIILLHMSYHNSKLFSLLSISRLSAIRAQKLADLMRLVTDSLVSLPATAIDKFWMSPCWYIAFAFAEFACDCIQVSVSTSDSVSWQCAEVAIILFWLLTVTGDRPRFTLMATQCNVLVCACQNSINNRWQMIVILHDLASMCFI